MCSLFCHEYNLNFNCESRTDLEAIELKRKVNVVKIDITEHVLTQVFMHTLQF